MCVAACWVVVGKRENGNDQSAKFGQQRHTITRWWWWSCDCIASLCARAKGGQPRPGDVTVCSIDGLKESDRVNDSVHPAINSGRRAKIPTRPWIGCHCFLSTQLVPNHSFRPIGGVHSEKQKPPGLRQPNEAAEDVPTDATNQEMRTQEDFAFASLHV